MVEQAVHGVKYATCVRLGGSNSILRICLPTICRVPLTQGVLRTRQELDQAQLLPTHFNPTANARGNSPMNPYSSEGLRRRSLLMIAVTSALALLQSAP